MRLAMPTISSVAAISRLSLMCTSSRRRRTSSSWMWRRSSRRCTVMPSAPPRCASTAAHTGSGSYVCRACRRVATWSMFTPSSITNRLLFAVERLQFLYNTPAFDAALFQVVIEDGTHQALRLVFGFGVGEAMLRKRDERAPAHERQSAPRFRNVARRALWSAIEDVM